MYTPWVQILPPINGAYLPETLELLKQIIGRKVQVVNHCNLYYKSYDTFLNGLPSVFLICKNDCVMLQQKD